MVCWISCPDQERINKSESFWTNLFKVSFKGDNPTEANRTQLFYALTPSDCGRNGLYSVGSLVVVLMNSLLFSPAIPIVVTEAAYQLMKECHDFLKIKAEFVRGITTNI